MDIIETGFFSISFFLIFLAIFIVVLVGIWRAFEKAGKPGWAAIIPFYNYYTIIKIGGKPGWWLLLMFIPLINIIIGVWVLNMVSKSFGKDEGFTLGLLFLGAIFWPILGFGSARYLGPYGDPAAFRAYQEKDRFDFEEK